MKSHRDEKNKPTGDDPLIIFGEFTRIRNKVLEALICSKHLGSREIRAVLFIIRYTYGYNKEKAPLAFSQFSNALGIPRKQVPKILKSLNQKKIIIVKKVVPKKGDRRPINYEIERETSFWNMVPKKRTHSKNSKNQENSQPGVPFDGSKESSFMSQSVPFNGSKVFPKEGTGKDIKENKGKDIKDTASPNSLISSSFEIPPKKEMSYQEIQDRKDLINKQHEQLKRRAVNEEHDLPEGKELSK